MPFNGSGTFNRVHDWTADAAAAIKIRADRMDAEMDGFATGLTNCVTRDGQSPATANIPMGGFRHTNVANASARTEYLSTAQFQDGAVVYDAVGGTADAITLTATPAITAYTAGMRIVFKAGAPNTGAVTVNRNGVGAKDLRYKDVALVANDLLANDVIDATYDGTRFQMNQPPRLSTFVASTVNARFAKLGLGMVPTNILDVTQNQNGTSRIQILNNDSGAAANAQLAVNNGTTVGSYAVFGTGFTTAGMYRQNGVIIEANGVGGLTLNNTLSQPIFFGVNSTLVASLDATKLDLPIGQIKFPTVQLASADNHTLDDYEESTFVPTLGDGTNNYTLSIAEGFYTKIGRLVHLDIYCSWTSIGSAGGGQLLIAGLPFTSNSTANYRSSVVIGYFAGLDTTATLNQIMSHMADSATIIVFNRANDNAAPSALPANSSSASGDLIVSATYMV